ncbi:MAG: prevent-host-death protein [Pyrinomonadaceae bacterium]
MLQTFKATLHGNQLEWNGEIPENQEAVSVIVTILDGETNAGELRPYGLSKNDFAVPEDFDAPLPEDILADFEN